MSLLIGSMTIGFILSLLALGVFLSFRVFAFPDITAEGSITLGASVAATLLVGDFSPLAATMAGFVSGMVAGATTGTIHDAILNRGPVPVSRANPDVPQRLDDIIVRAMEKDRSLRYQNAADLRADLQRLRRDTDSGRAAVTTGTGHRAPAMPLWRQPAVMSAG